MQVLNLIRPEKSEISYEIFHFPDGEVHIKLGEINRKEELVVGCRITNAEDLFILMQVGDILNRHEVKWYLTIYYLMSMRMDRVINFNEAFSLKVVTNMINSLNPSGVKVAHSHSDRALELLKAYPEGNYHPNFTEFENYQLCYPDKGAVQRYGQEYQNDHPILIGEKVRNLETGKIEKIIIKNPENRDYTMPIMVVDDLCDAGGTFIGIANAIKEIDVDANISISVVHMVNRKGIENLSKVYNKVIFTNTYKDWDNLPNNCEMIKVC